jgi:preprotein translocase subunit SecG
LSASTSHGKAGAGKIIITVMNILLYILFIVICIVFQYSEDRSTPVCPGREQLKTNDQTQRVISIIYAAFISALSLGIAIGFAVFGSRIVQSFNASQSTGNLKKTTAKVKASLVVCFLLLLTDFFFSHM